MDMGSSKRKSGFTIDDILQQQTETMSGDNILNQLPTTLDKPGEIFKGHTLSTSCPSAYTFDGLPKDRLNYEGLYSTPIPLYQHMLNLQKVSTMGFQVPFNVPPAIPYLDQYPAPLDKVNPRFFPLYSHPYTGYYISACGSKRKGGQIRFTPQQTRSLETRFVNSKYLSPEDRRHLAMQLKLSDRQVKTWFQNRRAKWRRSNNGSNFSENPEESFQQQQQSSCSTNPKIQNKLSNPQVTGSGVSSSSCEHFDANYNNDTDTNDNISSDSDDNVCLDVTSLSSSTDN